MPEASEPPGDGREGGGRRSPVAGRQSPVGDRRSTIGDRRNAGNLYAYLTLLTYVTYLPYLTLPMHFHGFETK